MSDSSSHPEMSPEMQPTPTQLAERLLGADGAYRGSQGDTVTVLGIGRIEGVESCPIAQAWALHTPAGDTQTYGLLNLSVYLPNPGYVIEGETGHVTGERITFGASIEPTAERKVSNARNTSRLIDTGDIVKMLQNAAVLPLEDQREVLKAIDGPYDRRVRKQEASFPRLQLHDLSKLDLSLVDERNFRPSWRIPAMEELIGGYRTNRQASKFGGWLSGRRRAA